MPNEHDELTRQRRWMEAVKAKNRVRFRLAGSGIVDLFPGWGAELPWQDLVGLELLRPETLRIFGRSVVTPRLSAWVGDPEARYRYSGRSWQPAHWTPALDALRQTVQNTCGVSFHGVLLNLYRDGRDSMGFHADNEPELGPTPENIVVASLSFGERRDFVLRPAKHAPLPYGARLTLRLGEGDLLIMRGTTQQLWVHGVPKRRQAGLRLNLTFRHLNACEP